MNKKTSDVDEIDDIEKKYMPIRIFFKYILIALVCTYVAAGLLMNYHLVTEGLKNITIYMNYFKWLNPTLILIFSGYMLSIFYPRSKKFKNILAILIDEPEAYKSSIEIAKIRIKHSNIALLACFLTTVLGLFLLMIEQLNEMVVVSLTIGLITTSLILWAIYFISNMRLESDLFHAQVHYYLDQAKKDNKIDDK